MPVAAISAAEFYESGRRRADTTVSQQSTVEIHLPNASPPSPLSLQPTPYDMSADDDSFGIGGKGGVHKTLTQMSSLSAPEVNQVSDGSPPAWASLVSVAQWVHLYFYCTLIQRNCILVCVFLRILSHFMRVRYIGRVTSIQFGPASALVVCLTVFLDFVHPSLLWPVPLPHPLYFQSITLFPT